MSDDSEEDLRTMLRAFRSNASQTLDEHGERLHSLEGRMGGLEGQVAELTDELRDRTRTMQTAILNAIRDLARDIDRRLTHLEG